MTQISGKKYQMKNAAETENRFPYTVMEAVLGLNSYLQQQFSALADIYMPIEGITETKTGQEFVYRKSPATIKAKSLTLNRIYGKTLAWNQLVDKGDFTDSSNIASWLSNGPTTAYEDNSMKLTGTSASSVYRQTAIAVVGHKYLMLYVLKGSSATKAGCGYGGTYITASSSAAWDVGTSWGAYRKIITAATTGAEVHIYGNFANDVALYVKTVNMFDITLLYGSEIDGLTDAQILEKFESEFPGYHDFGNKLISNDAESLETTGFNKWDEEWEVGIYNAQGEKQSYSGYIRSTNKVAVTPGSACYFKKPSNSVVIYFYDANGALVSNMEGNITTFTVPSNAYYLSFYVPGTTYNHDICINLSDPAKNGTYEPYRKSTMQLNLDSFQVRDGQGNVTTITGGLKSDRSGKYDEIVGGKFIQRASRRAYQSGDENDQTVVTDGTYTDYGLATPIEYELVEPLVYSMAAGTTEARISPNTDGLSAPFCCDMTYDANANNDSANAQYALTAGKLYNSHKLWGQDFDGSNDVSGALSGVTTIGASGNITTAAQLISTVATGTAPLSVASTTEVANLHSYTATKLHTQRTLWGQNFDGSGNVTGDMSSVGNIAFSASGKNIASLLYFDTTNSRVGVGTSSPAYKLDVSGSIRATSQLISSVATGTAPLSVASTTRVANLNADKLDDYEAVDFTSAIQSLWSQIDSLSTKDDFDELFATSLYADTIAASTVHLGLVSITGNTTIGGTLGVTGNTSLSGTLSVASNKATTLGGTLSVASTSTLTGRVGIGGAPDLTNALKVTGVAYATTGIYSDGYITAGAAAQSSDERLKSNIKEVMDGMSVISKLTPREWIWNEKNSYLSGKMGAGLIAQEVAKVLPFSVVDEGDYLALNYNVLHAYEISALQSHEARIKALEIENRKLKQKLNIN